VPVSLGLDHAVKLEDLVSVKDAPEVFSKQKRKQD